VSGQREDRCIYNQEDSMSKKVDALLAAEAKAAEEAEATSDIDAPLPAYVRVTCGHPPANNLQVRFSDDEHDQLPAYAEHRGLPVSTVVRMLVLQAIAPADDLKSAVDRLESDRAAVRRRALSA
jgi:outer membrane murein-binding lipoprotein Lpp